MEKGTGMCSVFNLKQYGAVLPPYNLLHKGINLDIDTPEELRLATGIMTAIQKGIIDYSLDETVHTEKGE